MNKQDFIKILAGKNISHQVKDGVVEITHHGSVDLESLTTLLEGVKFENHGYVDLGSLIGEQTYLGKPTEFITLDGITTIITSTKNVGDLRICKARYFGGGNISKLEKCFIVSKGETHSHGNTIEAAKRDLEYKRTKMADISDIASSIHKSKEVTLAQFRAVTGACTDGIRHHLSGLGIDLDTIDEMPLDKAITAMSGTSFGRNFMAALGEAQ